MGCTRVVVEASPNFSGNAPTLPASRPPVPSRSVPSLHGDLCAPTRNEGPPPVGHQRDSRRVVTPRRGDDLHPKVAGARHAGRRSRQRPLPTPRARLRSARRPRPRAGRIESGVRRSTCCTAQPRRIHPPPPVYPWSRRESAGLRIRPQIATRTRWTPGPRAAPDQDSAQCSTYAASHRADPS